ncbi:MAG TPA: SIMPL domain-containing protein [Patescibacteria group bacterium]|nr:SIMPL domain-containing protein [Patescibacteria group bacterium]
MLSLFERLKVPLITIFFALVLFFVLVKLFGPIPFSVTSVVTNKADLFTVEGTGEASGTPSSATFTVGVTKTGTTVQDTQNETNTAVNQVIAALKKQGIADKDIKTEDYTVTPNVDYTNGKQTPTGYTVSTNITVTLNDASKANAALDSATANGANIVNGVSFTLSDDEKTQLEDQARANAIKQAKNQAEKIAQQSGIRLGRLVNVSVNPTNQPVTLDKMSAAPALGGGAPTQLQPGENKVTLTVTLSYETL